jgi:glycerophosphoryl diester phosphodiesterase
VRLDGLMQPTVLAVGIAGVVGLLALEVLAPARPASVAAPTLTSVTAHTSAKSTRPLVIGHRGASGYRPEHTLGSYTLAIELGADYIEPDLVSTKDGVLVARHENDISGTTNVADHPEFAARRTTKVIDGISVTGWFTEDFTLRELKTLRAKERLPQLRPANTKYDGRYEIPTFQEVIDLARRVGRAHHRTIGIYPETKHPSYFASIGLPLEPPLLRTLRRNHLDSPDAPVFIQSFETGNLRRLATQTRVPLIQLIDASGAPYDLRSTGDPRTYADLASPHGLKEIAHYADGVGVNTNRIIPVDAAGQPQPATTLVDDAHHQGLLVHAWTLRRENSFLPAPYRIGTDPAAVGDAEGWFEAILDEGVDGVFSDNPDLARAAVRESVRAA